MKEDRLLALGKVDKNFPSFLNAVIVVSLRILDLTMEVEYPKYRMGVAEAAETKGSSQCLAFRCPARPFSSLLNPISIYACTASMSAT